MSLFSKIGDFLKKIWKGVKDSSDTIAIAITEEIQGAIKSGALASTAQIVEAVLPSTGKLPEELVAKLEAAIPKILAVELSIKHLGDSPTEADIKEFETAVLTAFGVLDDRSKLWSTLSAQIYGIIKADVDAGTKYTFAQCVIDVEKAWQYYQQDLADQSTN
jgi:hypothetical protein